MIINYSGCLEIEPENAVFTHVETQEEISGTDYLKLSETERNDFYILTSLASTIAQSEENTIEYLEIED